MFLQTIKKIIVVFTKIVLFCLGMVSFYLGLTYFLMLDAKNDWLELIQNISERNGSSIPFILLITGVAIVIIVFTNAIQNRNIIDGE